MVETVAKSKDAKSKASSRASSSLSEEIVIGKNAGSRSPRSGHESS